MPRTLLVVLVALGVTAPKLAQTAAAWESVQDASWGSGWDVVASFDSGEPVRLTDSPVTEWPLLSMGPEHLAREFQNLVLKDAVVSHDPNEFVLRAPKNLPDNRDILFEHDTRNFELQDIAGSSLSAPERRGRVYWRSSNMLASSEDSKDLWDFFLQRYDTSDKQDFQFDLRWLLYRLKHSAYDERPSVSLEAVELNSSTALKLDFRHESIVQLSGMLYCLRPTCNAGSCINEQTLSSHTSCRNLRVLVGPTC